MVCFAGKLPINKSMSKKAWLKDVTPAEIISLGVLQPLGPVTWSRLRAKLPSGRSLLEMGEMGWRELGLANAQVAALINRPTNTAAAERLLKSKNIRLLTIDEPDYPKLLKEIPDPPLWLYVRGDVTAMHQKSLTVVGTRKPSSYALTALKSVISEKLAHDIVINSGLAYGIDRAAHERSLVAGGRTVAVLAGGLDAIYPSDHYKLADKMVDQGGALVSEYPPLDRPAPWKFPVRNRILAGLGPATLVIEAKIKSGSLTTAKSAIDYNRDLFALPGDVTRPLAQGTNFLIKNGANLLDQPEQLEQYYGLKSVAKSVTSLDKELTSLVHLLSDAPKTVDQLVELSRQNVEQVLGAVTQLELLELICQTDTGAYTLKVK